MMGIEALKQRVASIETRIARSHAAASGIDLVAVRRAVAEELGAVANMAPEHVTETQSLTRRFGLDPLGRLELALALEHRLDLAPLADAASWEVVGDVVRDVMRTAGRR